MMAVILAIMAYGEYRTRWPNLVYEPPASQASGPPVIRVHPPATDAAPAAKPAASEKDDTQFALAQRAAAQREVAARANKLAEAQAIQQQADDLVHEAFRHPERLRVPPHEENGVWVQGGTK